MIGSFVIELFANHLFQSSVFLVCTQMIILEKNHWKMKNDFGKQRTSLNVFKIRVSTSRRLTRPFSNPSNFNKTSSI